MLTRQIKSRHSNERFVIQVGDRGYRHTQALFLIVSGFGKSSSIEIRDDYNRYLGSVESTKTMRDFAHAILREVGDS